MLKKYLNGNVLKFNIDFNPQLPKALSSIPNISLSSTSLTPPSIPNPADKFKLLNTNVNAKHYLGQLGSQLIDYGSQVLSNGLFGDDSEVGRAVGGAMSGTLGSVGNTLLDNFIKGNTLYEGLGKNAISGASGALGGLAASQVGKGITSIMGDSNLGRFTGGAASSALGQILGGGVGNPINFASNALGAGLSAMTGPSKEYGGKYGNVTQTMDAIYGAALGVVGMMGPVGAAISAGMALNKGLSNIFGSTSGMTKQDAILGSAFMPAPVKWLNMAGAETTDTLKNLSWQNSEKTSTFMLNAFGNLQAKLDDARDKAGKTYGTFSRGSYRDAQNAIDFANDAYGTLLAMADLNELQKIRSLYMTSINNQRYAQNIQGGWSPLAIGKQGMKIFNNATNHNMGMRLLSAAALIDNKQMILSFLGGGTPRHLKYKKPTGGAKKFRALTQEELENRTPEIIVTPVIQRTPEELNEEWERTHPNGGNADPNLSRVSDLTSEVFNLTIKPPFTGQEYQQAIEEQRLKKLDKFHEAEKIGEAALMADLAVSAAPLLQRGFRWAFDKAGLLIRVPIQRTNLFLTSPYTGKWTLFGNREYRFKHGYAAMNGAPIESRPVTTIRLYRATGTNGKFDASLDGGLEFAGQWFTNNPTKPQHYASMTVKRARRAGVENPIELLYVDIPESELSKYKASEILKGRTDIEYEPTEDFLIPLDYPRLRVPLEGYTGNLLMDARKPLPELSIESRPVINTEFPENISRFQGNSPIPTGHQGMIGYRPKQRITIWDPTKQDMVQLKNIDEVPNLRETINSILRRIKTEDIKPEFLNENAYVNAFRDNATRQGININDLSHEDVAKILTEQYNQLRESSSGILKDNVLWRTWGRTVPSNEFNWQKHLGEFTQNKGFWGKGNYFSTGVYGSSIANQPYMINGITAIGYDDLLGATAKAGDVMREGKIAGNQLATKWMSESPNTRIVAATENGARNRYGWLDTGNQGIEIVTLKNTGIKALNPDLTIGNRYTFPRDWSNPNVFRAITPYIIGGSTAATLYNTNK